MNSLSADLARALHADRQRALASQRLCHEARPTRPAARRPQPARRRQPGLLARLVPWFGVRAHLA